MKAWISVHSRTNAMDIRSATQDRSLLDALAVVAEHRHERRDELPGPVDLDFASPRWRSFVAKRRSGRVIVDRRALARRRRRAHRARPKPQAPGTGPEGRRR